MVLLYLAYDDLGRCHDNRIQTTEFEHHAIAAPQQILLKPLGHVLCARPISSKAITPPSPAPSNCPPHYVSLLRFAGRNRWTPLKPQFSLDHLFSVRLFSMSSPSKPAPVHGFPLSVAKASIRPDLPMKSGSETSVCSSLTYVSDLEKPRVDLEEPSLSGTSPLVSILARRIHGWSWQAVRLARPGASTCNRELIVYSFG